MISTFVNNGHRMRYRVNGRQARQPLVLLHGFCEDSRVWDSVMPYFKGIRVIRPDLPGFGGSDLPLAASMEAYSDAVCALLNELAVEKCVLVGHSMGGYTALAFAAQYPERLAGMGLVHSHPFADSPERKANRLRGIELVNKGKKSQYVAQLFPGLFTPEFAATHPEVLEQLTVRARRYKAEGITGALTAMMHRADHSDTVRQLKGPFLYVLGEKDNLVPPETAEILAPDTALHILPGVAHMSMFEAAGDCGELIAQFWNSVNS